MRVHLFAACAAAFALFAPAAALAQDHGAHAEAADHGHHHVDFRSGRFHVRVDGPEHPVGDVILIPGLTSSPEVWDKLTASLSGRYRVHRIHVQGFAGAPPMDNIDGPVSAPVAEDLARYIAEQGLDRPAVIGHSMGGTIAMMLAARHPDAVGRVMVVDMLPFHGNAFGGAGATPESVAPMAEMIANSMATSTPEAWAASSAQSVTGMIRTESERAGPIEDGRTSNPVVAGHAMRELIVTDLRPELPRITAPMTVLYVAFEAPGMTPELTDDVYQASFAGRPATTLKRIDASAHFIMLDQPEVFAAEVNDFLD